MQNNSNVIHDENANFRADPRGPASLRGQGRPLRALFLLHLPDFLAPLQPTERGGPHRVEALQGRLGALLRPLWTTMLDQKCAKGSQKKMCGNG